MLEYVFQNEWNPESISFLAWLTSPSDRIGPHIVEITSFLNFVMVWNEGISFGLFANDNAYQAVILSAISALICIGLIIWLVFTPSFGMAMSIGVIVGGALGNVLDRLRFGAVADFIDFHIMGWHYPSFNIADTAIVLGIAYLAFHTLFLSYPDNDSTNDK